MATAKTSLAEIAGETDQGQLQESSANDNEGEERSNLKPEPNLQDKKTAAKVRGYVDEVLDWMEEQALLAAKKKSILDRAEKEGFDRGVIVSTAKEIKNPTSREKRKKHNQYLAAYGVQGELFATPTEH